MQFTVKGHRYFLGGEDALYVLGFAGFSVLLGGSVYSVGASRCSAPNVLLNSFCSVANYVYGGLCPPGYQSFKESCVEAFNNGTSTLFSRLSSVSGFEAGEPIMVSPAAAMMLEVCSFPAVNHTAYPECVPMQVTACWYTTWNSFVASFKEQQDYRNCLDLSKQSAIAAACMTAFLLTTFVLAVKLCKTRELVNPAKVSATSGAYGSL